ncbi:IS3 family transposase [Halosquirtibacter xylanolyticus]|uniref:IS3 family transposase n=1 Tax=Halosquirtibacter xylanolyticus TaxID=3374599 RepID=UPI00374A1EBF|nr:IS3 family transposase [Prolixibacteraceae bacterium]
MKKSGGHILQDRQLIYEFIVSHSMIFPVEIMCKVLGVSSSSYYEWKSGRISKRKEALQRDTGLILDIYNKSKRRYGSHKIKAQLGRIGVSTSRNRVARIMQSQGIKSCICKSYKPQTTTSNHGKRVALNHLNREFTTGAPTKVWVSDLTYIPTDQGWLYLTTIMDLFDHSIVGWSMSKDMTAENTIMRAWNMAKTNRPPQKGMLFHSDQGVQFVADVFQTDLKKYKVIQSMSRKGNCWDNAVAENFFKIIKSELIDHKHYHSFSHAKSDIFDFIEVWYNKKRLHSVLGYRTPAEFMEEYIKNVA